METLSRIHFAIFATNSQAPSTSSAAAPRTETSSIRPQAILTDIPSQPSSTQENPTVTKSAATIETVASVSGGQTIFVTVTRDVSPTAQPDGSPPPGTNTPVGAISGGAVGGVVVIILLLFRYRRRKRANERDQATRPHSYPHTDISEHFGLSGVKIDGKVDPIQVGRGDLPQLEGRMIRPSYEMGADPVGNIAELAVYGNNPFKTPDLSAGVEWSFQPRNTERKSGGNGEYIMIWKQN